MAESRVCSKFEEAVSLLRETFCSCDSVYIRSQVDQALVLLESTYGELKNDVYYANLICKELYCKVRDARLRSIELLECALQALNDQGGHVDECCFGEADSMIRDAIEYLEQGSNLLCGCLCEDSCNSSACSSSSDCCDTSACDTSSCGTSSCDTTSCGTSSCDTSSSCSMSSVSCDC